MYRYLYVTAWQSVLKNNHLVDCGHYQAEPEPELPGLRPWWGVDLKLI